MCSRNVISALESIVSEYGNSEEIISDKGKQKGWNNSPSSHQSSLQQWSSLSNRQEYAVHDAYAKDLPQLLPHQPVWLQKASSVSLWQPAIVTSTPGANTPRSNVVPTPDGAGHQWNWLMLQWRVIPDEELPLPAKATSVNMSALLIRSELHSNRSDSPHVQNSLSTDNNKGWSILHPPKPTTNLMPKKDVPEGDATFNWDSNDYKYASMAYHCKLQFVINYK